MRLILLCLLLPLSIFAQNEKDTLRQLYDKHTLTYIGEGVMQNAELQPTNTKLFKDDLFLTQLKTVPDAYTAYKKSIRKIYIGVGALSPAMAYSMMGLGTLNVSNTPQLRNLTYTFLGLGAAFSVLTISNIHKSHTHYYHALWLYNRAAILRGYPDDLQKEKVGNLYDKTTIRLTGTGFIQNGVYNNRGWYNQKMTTFFANNVLASRHLARSKRAAFFCKPLQKIGLFGSMYGLGHTLTYEYHTPKQLKTAGYALLIGGALGIISIPLQMKSEEHLGKAVWFYNRDILTKY
jgi:hypothetical protein